MFQPLLGDQGNADPTAVERVVIASGKIYFELLQTRSSAGITDIPLFRVEQLYPFPGDALAAELRGFPRLRRVVWAQEEPRNHGAWHFLREYLEAILPPGVSLEYAGRSPAAPTAKCNAGLHAAEQRAVVALALGIASA
jgi:2-oxoglutarate dehydrogenase E1 component